MPDKPTSPEAALKGLKTASEGQDEAVERIKQACARAEQDEELRQQAQYFRSHSSTQLKAVRPEAKAATG